MENEVGDAQNGGRECLTLGGDHPGTNPNGPLLPGQLPAFATLHLLCIVLSAKIIFVRKYVVSTGLAFDMNSTPNMKLLRLRKKEKSLIFSLRTESARSLA